MPSSPFNRFAAIIALSAGLTCPAALAQAPSYSGIGRAPSPEEIGNLGIASGPSGKDLPPGKGTAKQGAALYAARCSMCHGRDGEGYRAATGSFSPLSGSRVSGGNSVPLWNAPSDPKAPPRVVTLPYYTAYVTSIWNTISVEMPYFRPGTLPPDQVYALTAFILFKNGLLKEDEVLDRETLPKIQMPNRNAFRPAADKLDEVLDIQKRACFKTYGICR